MKLRIETAVLIACFITAFSFHLTTELNHRAIVTALALDHDGDVYTATVTVFDSESSDSEKKNAAVLSASAEAAADAFALLQQLSERELFYKHNGMLLLGNGIGVQQMDEVLQLPINVRGIRFNISAIQCEGRAADMLTAQDAPDAAEFESFFKKQRRSINCEVPLVTLADSNGAASGMLPLISLEQGQIKLCGLYVFGKRGSTTLQNNEQMAAAALLAGRCAAIDMQRSVAIRESRVLCGNSGNVYCYIRSSSEIEALAAVHRQLQQAYNTLCRCGADSILGASGKILCTNNMTLGANSAKEVLLQVS